MKDKLLLQQCADAVILSGETSIPVSKFTCFTQCSVLRDLAEDVSFETTQDGKTILPVPGIVDPSCLQVTMDILHGILPIHTLTCAQCEAAFRGIEILGCPSTLTGAVMDRLWNALALSPARQYIAHAPKFLQSSKYRVRMLVQLVRFMPHWNAFRQFLENYDDMNLDLAVCMASKLVEFYPPVPVILTLLDHLPRDFNTVAQLLGVDGRGIYFHPRESIQVLTHVMHAYPWEPATKSIFAMMLDAHKRYEVAPHSVATLHGTVFTYEGNAAASALLHFDRPLSRHRCLVVTPWLTVDVYPTGRVLAGLAPWKIDTMAHMAPGVQVRLTASHRDGNVVEDVWYEWGQRVTPDTYLQTTRNVTRRMGDVAKFEHLMRHASLRSLRIDVFYGLASILDRPFPIPLLVT